MQDKLGTGKKWEYQCVLNDHFEQGLEKGKF